METIDPKTKIGDFIGSRILKFELLILAIIVFIFILTFLNLPSADLISTLVLMTVSVIYFFSSFAAPANTDFSSFDLFFNKLNAMGCSVSLIGILFRIHHWPNGKTMLTVGLITMVLSLAYVIYQRIRTPETTTFGKLILVRLIILILVSAGALYFEI